MIVARRLSLLGKKVKAVVEQQPACTGLLRNKIQCLDEFAIPLMTGCTVTEIFGAGRVSGVAVGPSRTVSEGMSATGVERGEEARIACDTLITSVGLVPERELLSPFANMGEDQGRGQRKGLPSWLFLCGNADYVHDLADDAADDGEDTGRRAAMFVAGGNARRTPDKLPAFAAPNGPGAPDAPQPCRKLAADEAICCICPESCILTIQGGDITGGACERGLAYARAELFGPERFVTATVRVSPGQNHLAGTMPAMLPVRSRTPVPKDRIPTIMRQIEPLSVALPVESGQVIAENLGGCGIDLIATATLRYDMGQL